MVLAYADAPITPSCLKAVRNSILSFLAVMAFRRQIDPSLFSVLLRSRSPSYYCIVTETCAVIPFLCNIVVAHSVCMLHRDNGISAAAPEIPRLFLCKYNNCLNDSIGMIPY